MLVLHRRPGQRVLIGNDIAVSVLHVRGERVSLGFEAPPAVNIVRGELVADVGAELGRAAAARRALLDRLSGD
jgi:carbon storage regulator